MPVAPTYPGVYIEEVPSGVRAITGVATAITAFIGRARRGPVNEPMTVFSFADYERQFGGLWALSTMSYGVRAFFQNGGGQAVIVRVAPGAAAAIIELPATGGNLKLVASSPGAWGNGLTVSVKQVQQNGTDLFNLIVSEKDGATEAFLNLSLVPTDPRFVTRVLAQASALVRVDVLSTVRPTAGTIPATVGSGKDGTAPAASDYEGKLIDKTGIYALEKTDLFNLLCIPPVSADTAPPAPVFAAAVAYCVERRAMFIVDPDPAWKTPANAQAGLLGLPASGFGARNAALFFPQVRGLDPEIGNQVADFAPSGAVAGLFARTDAQRGVWKAPAGVDASVNGSVGVTVQLTDPQIGTLNPLGINCIKTSPPFGTISWGARTLRGADQLTDEYKYVPIRRLALFIEESLFRGTQWVVFEPNDEPLWSQIRLNLGAFMQNLFRQGAFAGSSPRDAYFVKCDKETTTANDQNLGIVNIVVGFAPLKPAEFVIIKIQQIAAAQA